MTRGARTFDLALPAILILAAALRVHGITAESIDLDETSSLMFARLDLASLLWSHRDPGNPPLYYLLLKGWVWLFGDGEVALRLPSAILGTASVSALYFLARDLCDRTAARFAALLCALSSAQLALSQDARTYALTMLLAVTSTHALWRALSRPGRGRLALYVVLATLMAYSHYFGLVVALAQGISVAVAWATRRSRLGSAELVAAAALVLAIAPLVPIYLLRGGFLSENSPDLWQPHVSLDALASLGTDWLVGHDVIPHGTSTMALGLLVPALLAADRRRRVDAAMLVRLGVLYLGLAIFVVIASMKPVWHPRYVSALLPLFLLGLAVSRRALAAAFVVLALLGLLVAKLGSLDRPDWRGVAELVASRPAGEVLVLGPRYLERPFRYYGTEPLAIVPDRATLVDRATRAAASGRPVLVVYCDAHRPPDPQRESAKLLADRLGLRSTTHLRYLHVYELGSP